MENLCIWPSLIYRKVRLIALIKELYIAIQTMLYKFDPNQISTPVALKYHVKE